MSWHDYISLDSTELESRFAIEDSISFFDSIFDEPSEDSKEMIQSIYSKLDDLPAREADFLDMYYFRKMRQTEIAKIFNVSQPTVCYRLKRAAQRLHFMLKMPVINFDDLEIDLKHILVDPLDYKIMISIPQVACQSDIARNLNVSQGLVRHRLLRSMTKIKDFLKYLLHEPLPRKEHSFFEDIKLWNDRDILIESFTEYLALYQFLSFNLNVLREMNNRESDKNNHIYQVE